MARVNLKSLKTNTKARYLDLLWTSIAQLETREETELFFKDLLSESEAVMLARRIEIARRLLEGESYDNIIQELKVGKDTIGRVQRWLVSGFGGYEKAFKGLNRKLNKRLSETKPENAMESYSFNWLKKKYPLHFVLFSLLSSNNKDSKQKDMKSK